MSITQILPPGQSRRAIRTDEVDWTIWIAPDGVLCDVRGGGNREVFLLSGQNHSNIRYWFKDGGGGLVFSRGLPVSGILENLPGLLLPAEVVQAHIRARTYIQHPGDDTRVEESENALRIEERMSSQSWEGRYLEFDSPGRLSEMTAVYRQAGQDPRVRARWSGLGYSLPGPFPSEWVYEEYRLQPGATGVYRRVDGVVISCEPLPSDARAVHYVSALTAGITEVPADARVTDALPDFGARIASYHADLREAYGPVRSSGRNPSGAAGAMASAAARNTEILKKVLGGVGGLLILGALLFRLMGRTVRSGRRGGG